MPELLKSDIFTNISASNLVKILEQNDYDSAYIISEVLFVYNKFNSIKWYLNAFKFKKEHNKDPWRPRDNL